MNTISHVPKCRWAFKFWHIIGKGEPFILVSTMLSLIENCIFTRSSVLSASIGVIAPVHRNLILSTKVV